MEDFFDFSIKNREKGSWQEKECYFEINNKVKARRGGRVLSDFLLFLNFFLFPSLFSCTS